MHTPSPATCAPRVPSTDICAMPVLELQGLKVHYLGLKVHYLAQHMCPPPVACWLGPLVAGLMSRNIEQD